MTIARPRTEAPRRRRPSPRLGRVGTRGGRAAFLATGPSAWYDARDLLSTTQQTLVNRVGTSIATLGSTSGSDTNDPVTLVHSGRNYVFIPTPAVANANKADVTSVTAPTGATVTLEIDVFAGATGTTCNFIGLTNAFHPYLEGGNLKLLHSTAPTGTQFVNFGAHGMTANQWTKLRFTRTKSTGVVVAERSTDDGATWSTVGTSAAIDAGSNLAAATTLRAGYGIVTHSAAVGIRSCKLDGTELFDVPGSSQTTWGNVTVARDTTGLTTAVVTRPLLMADGTDDYVQLPAGDTPTFTATTGAYTVMLINRVHNLAGAATFSRVWSSESAANNGARIFLNAASAVYTIGVGGSVATANDSGSNAFTATTQLHAVALVVDNGIVYGYTTTSGIGPGVATTGVGTVTHTSPRVASRGDSVASPADLETYAVVHWTRALTSTELDTASAYLLGTYV